MDTLFNIDPARKTPKYLQIIHSINQAILRGKLRKGDQIFSINELSEECYLGRETVQKAYNILRKKGVLVGIPGKGFFVNRTDLTPAYRILLLFNKISNYKRQIYNAFVQTIGDRGHFDLKIHHSNVQLFENQLAEHLGDYDYYVIMPHFYEGQDKVKLLLKTIPPEKLVLMDKDLQGYPASYAAVYQDFKADIHDALEEALDLLCKYRTLILVQPTLVPHPAEIAVGFRNFCMNNCFRYRIIDEIDSRVQVCTGEAYVVIEETDLVNLIKMCRAGNLLIGKDVGIVSYNDTPLKEILLDGITVISTDHARMGETAARLILENRQEKIKNPFVLIRRKSL
jgi:DNA-binding transcriptional regulator YhcF (GntR family)